jgi:glycosyltransferase involved in cell wall biosynthesis
MPDSKLNPLRVLHYLDAVREEAGGVVRCVIDLCSVLASHGVDVILATRDTKDVPAEWRDRPDAPRVFDMRSDRMGIGAALSEADVVHLHTPWDWKNVRFARFLRIPRVPYIVSVHGMLDDWCMKQKGMKKGLYLWLLGRRMLEGAYRVHCTAEGEAQQAGRWYPLGRSVVLPLVVDLPAPSSLPGPELANSAFSALHTPDPKVLFLSRLHPKKGVDHLLRAAAQVCDRGMPLELIIAGPGDPRYLDMLRGLANQLDIADRTHFVGHVHGARKLSLYQACDLFVLPTHQENFGLVLPEAMACGTPVVTTRGVDIWPEIEAGGGVIVDNQPEILADALTALLGDRQALSERGERGRHYVYEWLDPERVVQGYIELYQEAASSRRQSKASDQPS